MALKFVRESRGIAVRVPDDVLLSWHRDLACKEGLFVEPSSAAAVAAVDLLRRQGTIRAGDTVTCLLTAFRLTASVATPILGKLGDQFGKERLLLISLSVFLLGSVAAVFAPSIWVLIACRAVQGTGAAVFPLSFAIIKDEFPP